MHGSNLMHGACSLPFSNGASTSFLGGDQSDISVRLAFRPGLERNEQVTEHTRATRRNIRAFPSDYDIIDRRLLLSREHPIGIFFTPTAKATSNKSRIQLSLATALYGPMPYFDVCPRILGLLLRLRMAIGLRDIRLDLVPHATRRRRTL